MKKINNYDELNKLIMKHMKKGVYTNCFISKAEFEDEIKNQNLFYHLYDGGLLIFRKMCGYYKLNFYITNLDCELDVKFNDVIVTEIVCKPGIDYTDLINFFVKNGMIKKLKRVRLFNENANINIETKNIEKVNLKDYEKVVKLFDKNFDKYIGCIPNEQNLKLDIINGNLYCYKENDNLLGILHISNNMNQSNIKHLVVDENYRKKGIAKLLVNKYFEDFHNTKKYVWTGEDNEIAQKTYLSLGYRMDEYYSYVLVFEECLYGE